MNSNQKARRLLGMPFRFSNRKVMAAWFSPRWGEPCVTRSKRSCRQQRAKNRLWMHRYEYHLELALQSGLDTAAAKAKALSIVGGC